MNMPYIHNGISRYGKWLSAVTLAIAGAACDKVGQPEIPTLEVAVNIDSPDKATLNDIFEFRGIIRPELTDSTLLSYANVRGMRGDVIYIQENNRLMTFNMKNGHCISSFDHTGQGAEEYNILSPAFPSEVNGDWVAYDVPGQKIVRYTQDGKFVGSYPAAIDCLCPDHEKWVGQKNVPEGYNQVIYVYNDRFELTDTIQTHLPRYFLTPNILDTFNGRPVMKAQDTLYTVTADNRFVPVIAFNLDHYSMPNFKEDEFEKMMAERWHYLKFDFNGVSRLGGISYQFNDKVTLQFYSLNDYSLVYSASVFPAHFNGFPYIANGTKYNIMPMGQPTKDIVFASVSSDQLDDPKGNPAIILLKPKAKYL